MTEKPALRCLSDLPDNREPADVPASLRDLAHQIEFGRCSGRNALYVVIPRADDYPMVMGFGPDLNGDNHPHIQLDLARHLFASKLLRRS